MACNKCGETSEGCFCQENNVGKAIERNAELTTENRSGITMEAWLDDQGRPQGMHLSPIGTHKPEPEAAVMGLIYCVAALCRQMNIDKKLLLSAMDDFDDAVDATDGGIVMDITQTKGN